VLASLGFTATRGIGTMLRSPNTPPNHGTVFVEIDGARYLADASILHGSPLRLEEQAATEVVHPAWGVRCERRDGRWHVHWRPFHALDGRDCRIERTEAAQSEFHELHEETRPWSFFNYALYARVNRDEAAIGTALGLRMTLDGTGERQEPLASGERIRFLVEHVGMSEEIASRVPSDKEIPPPPWAQPEGGPS
jgi:N-hydroxyarylamine O-acetyltransferase